jgi:hypothetical protein
LIVCTQGVSSIFTASKLIAPCRSASLTAPSTWCWLEVLHQPQYLDERGYESPVYFRASMPIHVLMAGSPLFGLRGLALALSRSPLCLLASGEAVAFAIHLQDMDMMSEPVE